MIKQNTNMEIKMDLLVSSNDKEWWNIIRDKLSKEINDVKNNYKFNKHKYFNEYVIRWYVYDNEYKKHYNETTFYLNNNCNECDKNIIEFHVYDHIYITSIEQLIQELHNLHDFEIYIQENKCT